MTDLGAVAPPMGERVPQGIVFEEIAAVSVLVKIPSFKRTWSLRCFPKGWRNFHTLDFNCLSGDIFTYEKELMTSTYIDYRFRTSKNMIFGELLR